LRTKLAFVDGHKLTPAVTLVPTIFLPMATTQELRAGALVFLGWELGGFDLEVNVGALAQPNAPPHVLAVFATAITHRVVGPLSAFIDVYATGLDVQLGTGFLAPIGRDVQIDFGTYVGLAGAEFGATPFVGLSFRR
jgi:hypothetical protein